MRQRVKIFSVLKEEFLVPQDELEEKINNFLNREDGKIITINLYENEKFCYALLIYEF